jgi:hypothetical protein
VGNLNCHGPEEPGARYSFTIETPKFNGSRVRRGTLPEWVVGFTEDGRLGDHIMVGDIHFEENFFDLMC